MNIVAGVAGKLSTGDNFDRSTLSCCSLTIDVAAKTVYQIN